MKHLVFAIFLLSFTSSIVKCDSVCTAKVLIQELVEDLNDNNRLDCLLKPLPLKEGESPEERKIRMDGAWDTDCAFQSSYDWYSVAKENYGISTGLVNSLGNVVEDQFDDQADICELIRAMINADLFEGYRIGDLKEEAFDRIECPGPSDQAYQICAASGGSANQKYTWTILLESSAFKIVKNEIEPNFELDPMSKRFLEQRKAQGSMQAS